MRCKYISQSYGAENSPREFDSFLEALRDARSDVESNAAAPKRITLSGSTVIGAKGASFDSIQIYALLELLDEMDEKDSPPVP